MGGDIVPVDESLVSEMRMPSKEGDSLGPHLGFVQYPDDEFKGANEITIRIHAGQTGGDPFRQPEPSLSFIHKLSSYLASM